MYARFTKTVLCNTLVQRSIEPCDLSEDQSASLCADSCAQFAQSEAYLTSDSDLCSDPNRDLTDLIRADFTTCSLPARALFSRSCISGEENESENCGFGNSTIGLCAHCAEDDGNDADTCCYRANVEERCEGIELPAFTTTMTFDTATVTALPTATGDPSDEDDNEDGGGLSGGAIAGIVIGAVAGIALIAAALFFCIRRMRKREGSQQGSIFNQPSPSRKGKTMSQSGQTAPQGYEVLPGGRIARMSALEGHSGDSSSQRVKSMSVGTAGVAAGYMAGGRKGSQTQSSSSDFGDSLPGSEIRGGPLRPPPSAMRRNGSLSSNSVFNSVPQSPTSAEGFSPQGLGSQQSEQLPFFKDYYSQDDIHPGDRVSVLWAYQPRATDEFGLERGDMLKVVGIWDDGWATGVLMDERADEWDARRQAQRDSGVSNASGRRESSPAASGEIKAFPLVCVCLPEHWRKTIEDGDGSTGTGSNNPLASFA
jgi:hypothetical protein